MTGGRGTLAELGCMRVWIGSESGSQRILDAMQRGVTVEQVRHAISLLKQNRFKPACFSCGVTKAKRSRTSRPPIDHVKRCRPDIFFTTVSYPIKGTPYFDKVASRLVNVKSWRETTDREMQIPGRHSRRFYQYADELLRSEMSERHDTAAIDAARAALYTTTAEVEA